CARSDWDWYFDVW
nr:immunoglobulin heavy chain junction region [Mus musculus]